MRNRILKVLAVLAFAFLPQFAFGQVNSNTATVALSMPVNASLTVTATPASISFTPTDSTHATASGPISVTTSWNLTDSDTVETAAYFTSATSALTNGTSIIPPSSIKASVDGGTVAVCSQTIAMVTGAKAGATCPAIFTQATAPLTGTSTDTLLLSINHTAPFVAGTYSGIITISASAF